VGHQAEVTRVSLHSPILGGAAGARDRPRRRSYSWCGRPKPGAEEPLIMHIAQLAWITEHGSVCFLGPWLFRTRRPAESSGWSVSVDRDTVNL
jgi:hypothetical protein